MTYRSMDHLNLRKATANDSDLAYDIKKAAFREYVERLWGWKEEEQRQLHQRRYNAQSFRMIQVSGLDVGLLATVRESDCINVKQLFILPEHQGKGIGKSCMLEVIKEVSGLSLPIRLQVLKINTGAHAFFRRLGFEEIGETDTHKLMERPS